jgi:hypothetical protein
MSVAPDLLERGGLAFGGGRFLEAQILWEAEARHASSALRAIIAALAQVAAGMLAHDEQRLATAERLLADGAAGLTYAPAWIDGVDVTSVRTTAETIIAQLRRGAPVAPPALVVLSAS